MRSIALTLLLAVACSFAFTQTLTIRVHAPSGTPDTASLYVAGNLHELGSWQPNGLRMSRINSSVWSASMRLPRGTEVEFKVTLGTWDDEALFRPGEVPPNVRLVLTADTTIELFPVSWKDLHPDRSTGITGTVRYHRGVKGEGLTYLRRITVWLPPSYDSALTRRYPVLYMHDGQNVFDRMTAFGGNDWRVDEVADSLIRAGAMEEIIAVAISNSPDRALEYSDTRLGRAYAAFVAHQLKPMIDSVYRTKPDRANTAVMGSSMGGLISFLFVWWYPEVFSKAACLSSAFRWDDNRIVHEVEAAGRLPRDIVIYLDCGTVGLEASLRPGFERMVHLLQQKGLEKGETLMGFLDEGAEHTERAWAARLWRPLEFLFPVESQRGR